CCCPLGTHQSPSERPDHACCHSNTRKDLHHLANVLQVSASGDFVGHVDGVTRLQHHVGRIAGPEFAGASSHYGSVRAYYENVLLVGYAGGTAGLAQVPSSALALAVRDGRRVVHLPGYHDEVRAFGNNDAVAWTYLDIHGRVFPFFDGSADVDQHPAAGRNLPNAVDQLLPLAGRGGALQASAAYALLL